MCFSQIEKYVECLTIAAVYFFPSLDPKVALHLYGKKGQHFPTLCIYLVKAMQIVY